MKLSVTHICQTDVGECLVACAKMVLNYCGVQASYRGLVKLLKILPQVGAPAYNIKQIDKFGVSVIYRQGTLNDLRRELSAGKPCIAFVEAGELPHWDEKSKHALVVVGMDNDFVYVNDPIALQAPIPVPIGDFDLAWLEQDEWYAVINC